MAIYFYGQLQEGESLDTINRSNPSTCLCLSQLSIWISNVKCLYMYVHKESLNSDGEQFHQYQQN
jgi:hypothetical protein